MLPRRTNALLSPAQVVDAIATREVVARMATLAQFCEMGSHCAFTRVYDAVDELWICRVCGGPSRQYEVKQVGICYFRGGPLDNMAYETATLLTSEARALPLHEYSWTKDKVTSPSTGAEARVWVHKSLLAAIAVEAT